MQDKSKNRFWKGSGSPSPAHYGGPCTVKRLRVFDNTAQNSKKKITLTADMSMFICSLNSGSNANCYYIGNQDEAILVDGGLSCRETEKRLKRLGLFINKIKAIFVSHEHGDHVHGIPAISKKYQLPVYITTETLQQSKLDLKEHLIAPLRAYDAIKIGNLSVTAFPSFMMPVIHTVLWLNVYR